ncbi:MAG: L-seryl-tRNA(Sec) selenium transferase [Alicyclobacillus sp. RIFOXYA1_FULL_53_8]|nr:MAG: L-seryl-tRNA(Sec) selenium transferase [Alicyclobacillus sp. RIFOXYA1_FULL_53_8]
MDKSTAYRSLPAVHRVLALPETQERLGTFPLSAVSKAVSLAVDELRNEWRDEPSNDSWWLEQTSPRAVLERAEKIVRAQFSLHLRPVLNLTGVVIHTNLGRAPLSERALAAVTEVARGYSNLEYDLEQGKRGSRHSHIEQRLCALTGAEAALVVNNNAAAVFLVLRELGRGGAGIVSRGQLVEIGGSFRVPEIMRESGVDLVEVGTTNKTKLADYENAIDERIKLILRVHTSNFRILGFTEQPSLKSLADLAHSHDLPLFEDLGSGALFDYAATGIGDDPTIMHSLAAGVDVLSFSGDKLLGGAQAGIIIGKKRYIERLKKNQLARALRVDKMTLAALEATLVSHLDDELARTEVPVVRMLTAPESLMRERGEHLYEQMMADERIVRAFTITLTKDESRVGGGALPLESLPSVVLRLSSHHVSVNQLFDDLRMMANPPIVGRITDDELILDVRTLLPGQESILVRELSRVAARHTR